MHVSGITQDKTSSGESENPSSLISPGTFPFGRYALISKPAEHRILKKASWPENVFNACLKSECQ
jgi:hypothetical protein